MSVSTVPLAVAGLQTLVKTQVATDAKASQILVCLGEPGMDEPADIIQLATNVRRTVKPETFMGSYTVTGPLRETFDIECIVSSWTGGPDALTCLNRAYVLLSYLETAVRTDPTLGGNDLEAHPSNTAGGQPEWTDSPTGRLVTINASISVQTLI